MGTDSVMGAKGRLSASEAIDHLRKHFKCEAIGSLRGKVIASNSIKAILNHVHKLHEPKKKKLESIYIKFTIHGSDTCVDYAEVLPVIAQITTGLRDELPKATSVNYMNCGYEVSNKAKIGFDCFIVEKELWQ